MIRTYKDLLILGLLFFLPINPAFAKEKDLNQLWKKFKRIPQSEAVFALYPYKDCFRKASRMYQIPPVLLLAVAKGESDFDPEAVSRKDCHGIMQINWSAGTAGDLGFKTKGELYDACRNIMAGARYLRWMLNMHGGNIHLALAAYNYGPGNIPKGTSPYRIPQGANFYSGYVYHHVKTILARSGIGSPGMPSTPYRAGDCKLPIIVWDENFRAEAFIEAIRKRDKRIRLDWFRNPKGEYTVVMLCKDKQEERDAIARLKKVGYKVKQKDRFGQCVKK